MTPKNYYLYFHKGKVKRQAIRLNDVYPESYAMSRIPNQCEIFAKIILTGAVKLDYGNGNPVGIWQRHAFHDYPESEEQKELWQKKQKEYCEFYFPMLNKEEKNLLKIKGELK